jgi:hypothetical protein
MILAHKSLTVVELHIRVIVLWTMFAAALSCCTGEGIFLRGPGDFCTAALPCSEEVSQQRFTKRRVLQDTAACTAQHITAWSR